MSTSAEPEYRYLAPRPGLNYRQYYLKDRRKIRAEILYRMTVGPDPRTPEQVAIDYDVPIEAVREAIDYSVRNERLLARRARSRDGVDPCPWFFIDCRTSHPAFPRTHEDLS